MRITTINTNCAIDSKTILKSLGKREKIHDLEITVYVEEDFTRHITLNVSPDMHYHNGFDIWMDIDIYQAELLGKKILQLVENRKQYLESKLNE